MSRVEINAGGRHVIVDHAGELAQLAETAQRLWDATQHGKPDSEPATGFQVTERAQSGSGEIHGKWGRTFKPVRVGFGDLYPLGTADGPPTSGE